MLRSASASATEPGSSSRSSRIAFCSCASRVPSGLGSKRASSSHALAAGFHQQVDVRLGLAAPGGEQTVAHFLALVAAARRQVAEPLGGDHLEPVFGAGIDHVHMHVDPAAQRLQGLDVQRRHGGQREHVDGLRQAGAAGQLGATAFQRLDQQGHGMIGAELQFARDALPQRGLPALVGALPQPQVALRRSADMPPASCHCASQSVR